jgi:hypothetical protein
MFQQFFLSFTKGLVGIHGYADIAADASVAASVVRGGVVTKTGTGEYTLTLEDKYVGIESVQLTLQAATAVNLVPQIKATDVVSAKTIVFNLNAAAVPTNPSAACRVYIALRLKNSTAL